MDPARELEDLRSLLEAPSPAVLMTYRPDGSADVSPVWFRYTGEAFEVVVAKSNSKLGHLARDPRGRADDLRDRPSFPRCEGPG